jgi:hypothetical protein
MLSQPESSLTSTSTERRSVLRLSAGGKPARIAWKEKGFPVRKVPALLIDITANGAGLLTARSAEPGHILWLGIQSLPLEWVKAAVRCVLPDGLFWRFHIAFCEPCPVGLLEEAIGLSARNEKVPSIQVPWDDDDDIEVKKPSYSWAPLMAVSRPRG